MDYLEQLEKKYLEPIAEIELPKEAVDILEQDMFELEVIDDQLLSKLLYYAPEMIRLVSIGVAELQKRIDDVDLEIQIQNEQLRQKESELLLSINGVESHKYKNEQMRNAYIWSDKGYKEIQGRIFGLKQIKNKLVKHYSINDQKIWKLRNLLKSLDTISKLRISERKY